MSSTEAILVVLVIVVIVVMVCAAPSGRRRAVVARRRGEGFHTNHPYAILQQDIEKRHGVRHDAFNQQEYIQAMPAHEYHQTGGHIRPEDLDKAQQEAWFAAVPPAGAAAGNYDADQGYDASSDASQYHTMGPAMDYDGFLTDLVAGPRMRENHARWAQEMAPWSGTARKVDTLEVENYVPFVGLRRPQPVPEYNPLQLNEVDSHSLARGANDFRFQG